MPDPIPTSLYDFIFSLEPVGSLPEVDIADGIWPIDMHNLLETNRARITNFEGHSISRPQQKGT